MIRRVLAVIVALSLFVCTVVVGFATGTTIRFNRYIFPTFTRVAFYGHTGSISYGPVNYNASPSWIYGLPSSCTVSLSSLSTPFRFLFLSIRGEDKTTYVHDGNSQQQEYYYDGVKAGYYTSHITFTTPFSFSSSDLSSVTASVAYSVGSGVTANYLTTDVSCVFVSSSSSGDSYTYSFSVSYYIPYDLDISKRDFQIRLNLSKFITISSCTFSTGYGFYNPSAPFNPVDQDIGDVLGSNFSNLMSHNSLLFSNLISFFKLQQSYQDKDYNDAVPDGLPGQQDEAQKQLEDYEQKEQQIFDNLDTSLDNLNLGQYQNFDTSIVSSMTFINRYVTKGFDGLGNFKIILFLPMVIGIGLSVIGRMGAMMSHISVSDRRKGRGP